jgi:hypothetical protein
MGTVNSRGNRHFLEKFLSDLVRDRSVAGTGRSP